MVKRRGKIGNHAEGEHGPRTHAKIVEQLETSASASEDATPARKEAPWKPDEESGKHRLVEGRQQHDEAEKQSERRRLENEE